jgi:hypothetical protein
MKFAEYMDMTSVGVFVHCTVEEGKLILEKILSVTPLEDLHPKPPTISEVEPITTYPDSSYVSVFPASAEMLHLTTPELDSNEDIENPTPFPLSI